MIPPIEGSILQSNPKFALLHTALTKNLLNASGSTKFHPAQKERDAVSEELKTARKHAAKCHFLHTAIADIDLSPSPTLSSSSSSSKRESKTRDHVQYTPLPAELIEVIILFSANLRTSYLHPSSKRFMESTDQWNALPTHIPAIAALASKHIQKQALALARIASPSTNASFLHRGIPRLIGAVEDLQQGNDDKRAELQARRTALVGKSTTLLGVYYLAIALSIRILEQSKHGSMARHVKTKAEYLNIVARTLELESTEKSVRGHRIVYTEDVNSALDNYMRCLRDGRERGKEKKGDMERVLWGYGVGRPEGEKERVMKEIAKVYGELGSELREVGKDVERLKGH